VFTAVASGQVRYTAGRLMGLGEEWGRELCWHGDLTLLWGSCVAAARTVLIPLRIWGVLREDRAPSVLPLSPRSNTTTAPVRRTCLIASTGIRPSLGVCQPRPPRCAAAPLRRTPFPWGPARPRPASRRELTQARNEFPHCGFRRCRGGQSDMPGPLFPLPWQSICVKVHHMPAYVGPMQLPVYVERGASRRGRAAGIGFDVSINLLGFEISSVQA
jgi:hypothetical protein